MLELASPRYTENVARGWESKLVENQISEREIEIEAFEARKKKDRLEIERNTKREGILLVRSRTLTALESTRDERYQALLQRTLTFLDAELDKLK